MGIKKFVPWSLKVYESTRNVLLKWTITCLTTFTSRAWVIYIFLITNQSILLGWFSYFSDVFSLWSSKYSSTKLCNIYINYSLAHRNFYACAPCVNVFLEFVFVLIFPWLRHWYWGKHANVRQNPEDYGEKINEISCGFQESPNKQPKHEYMIHMMWRILER